MDLTTVALLFSASCNFVFILWFFNLQKQIDKIIEQTNEALKDIYKKMPTLSYAFYEGSN